MRVFQLTAPQPVDEVLECLGDALSADQNKLPVIMGCSRMRNQDGEVSTSIDRHHNCDTDLSGACLREQLSCCLCWLTMLAPQCACRSEQRDAWQHGE